MTTTTAPATVHADDAWGVLSEPATLTIRRVLPGPIERVWAYLTDSDLRRQWLAAGRMELAVGAPFELVWRNDELTDPPGERPAGFGAEHRMQSRITECEPPRRLSFAWQNSGDVTFALDDLVDGKVLLTLTHRRLPDGARLNIAAGWHAHLDVLVASATGARKLPFWDGWKRLRDAYERRLAA
nr:SRPBCC family protein [Caldimonas sp.]